MFHFFQDTWYSLFVLYPKMINIDAMGFYSTFVSDALKNQDVFRHSMYVNTRNSNK